MNDFEPDHSWPNEKEKVSRSEGVHPFKRAEVAQDSDDSDTGGRRTKWKRSKELEAIPSKRTKMVESSDDSDTSGGGMFHEDDQGDICINLKDKSCRRKNRKNLDDGSINDAKRQKEGMLLQDMPLF